MSATGERAYRKLPSYAVGHQSLATSRRRRGPPTPRSALEHMPMMKYAIEHGRDRCYIAQQLPPVLDGSVRCQQCTDALVAAHDDLQQIFGCGHWQLAHSKVI